MIHSITILVLFVALLILKIKQLIEFNKSKEDDVRYAKLFKENNALWIIISIAVIVDRLYTFFV